MVKLPDNDIRDIRKFLEEGKPLPDKYRFMLFEDKKEVELVWNGKTNIVTSVVLPFQTIEQIDEPREETDSKNQNTLFDMDTKGRQIKGWTNKLIWGDNKLILSSLKNGPLRKDIEDQRGIKLIYIDPPFDVGADFSMGIEIGDEQFTKQPSVLEELAYRDTWGRGTDSFISMIYERLSLMKDLMADDGSIYVHCDYHVSAYLKLVLDEVFGNDNFGNEIIWKRSNPKSNITNKFAQTTDTIYRYYKTENFIYNQMYSTHDEEYVESAYKYTDDKGQYRLLPLLSPNINRPNLDYEFLGVRRVWRWSRNRMEEAYNNGLVVQIKPGAVPQYKKYLSDSKGKTISNLWQDIQNVSGEYPTQKPEELVKRIIETSSGNGDIIADFFCGSGTTLAVAEKLNRKWIGADLGKFAIHTARKRLTEVQRQLKKEGKDYRAFEILNIGKYERQYYAGINPGLSDSQKQQQISKKEQEFIDLILKAYKAESIIGFKTVVGKKLSRLVAVGPISMPVTQSFVGEVISECLEKQITKVDILAFEFEMGLFPKIQEEAKSKGVDLALKYIPREVFDKRAVEKNQVAFYDVSFIEVKPHINGQSVAMELTDFSVFYNQDILANVEADLGNGSSKIVVDNGQIIKVFKDKSGIVEKEILTKKWADWIDYWAVDFNYQSKKEMIRVVKEGKSSQIRIDGTIDPKQMKFKEYEEKWTGGYIFENDWQTFRTKKNRELELTSVYQEVEKGKRKIAIKVVDIFGNDTMKVIEVNI